MMKEDDDYELEDYSQKISEFRDWLKRHFVTDGCGDPKVDGCLSCEAVLINQGLDAMIRIMKPPKAKATERC